MDIYFVTRLSASKILSMKKIWDKILHGILKITSSGVINWKFVLQKVPYEWLFCYLYSKNTMVYRLNITNACIQYNIR